jgi:hypothetical protein
MAPFSGPRGFRLVGVLNALELKFFEDKMEKDKTKEAEALLSEFDINCTTTLQRNRVRVVSFKVSAPRELFLLTDALAKHGAFPTLEQYVSGKVSALIGEYLGRAEEVVAKAAELSKSGRQSR